MSAPSVDAGGSELVAGASSSLPLAGKKLEIIISESPRVISQHSLTAANSSATVDPSIDQRCLAPEGVVEEEMLSLR